MAHTSCLLLLLLTCGLCLGQIMLETECPQVELSESANCPSTCQDNAECQPYHWCCPNACGTSTCTNVMASCTENGNTILHHDMMTFIPESEDQCGDCWCQSGQKECVTYNCNGPMP